MIGIGKDFWENKHSMSDGVWLTGTRFELLSNLYTIEVESLRTKSVLEIGVGLGFCSVQFQKYAARFYCADISQHALDRVKNCSNATFLTTELKNAPPVDLAICHLVFVHCNDEEVLRIINDTNLTETGKFMFQLSSFAEGYVVNERVQRDLIDNGSHFFRSFDHMQKIIKNSNKEIVACSDPWDPGSYLDYDKRQVWRIVTLQNKRENL